MFLESHGAIPQVCRSPLDEHRVHPCGHGEGERPIGGCDRADAVDAATANGDAKPSSGDESAARRRSRSCAALGSQDRGGGRHIALRGTAGRRGLRAVEARVGRRNRGRVVHRYRDEEDIPRIEHVGRTALRAMGCVFWGFQIAQTVVPCSDAIFASQSPDTTT